MVMELLPLLFSSRFSLTLLMIFTATSATISTTSKPGCPTNCGNITVPYPFGISQDGRSCSLSRWYNINCNTSFNPPRAFWGPNNHEVMEISQTGQMRIKNIVARTCYGDSTIANIQIPSLDLKGMFSSLHDVAMPFVFSDTENKLTGIGCDDTALILEVNSSRVVSGCIASCPNLESALKYDGSCLGVGCCQTSIPKGLTMLLLSESSIANHSSVKHFNPCGHAFLGEQKKFTFNVDDLSDPAFRDRIRDNVPIVLEWVVGVDETCHQALQNPSTYACQNNTICTNFDIGLEGGYRCNCLPGYKGNPYLSPGCTDIDECASDSSNPCTHKCSNTPGGFICSCPKGFHGDGKKTGKGCIYSQLVMTLSLGIGFGCLFLLILVSWVYYSMRRRNILKIREKLFDRNGGLLLKQKLSPAETSNIFSADELRTATNNYSEDRILGKGGFGTVYMGILKDGREVAIKKPKQSDQNKSQIQEFINEVVILMQTNHKNVVKVLGCCLETKVPLLVYEFISNGTLLESIRKGGSSWLNWDNCIRIAIEIVDALAYLHSAALTPIIHRDIKSANILLDDSYTAKIADFGASRLAPIGKTQASTEHLLGTRGYIDPESFQTGRLTEKSDVYSFGVVLAELLTKEKVLSSDRAPEEASLAVYFVSSMKRNCLLDIIDPQLVKEATEEQLMSVGKLVMRCLDLDSGNRPTMREVAVELDGLKKQMNHPWVTSERSNGQENTSLVGQRRDLYPSSSSSIDFNSSTTDLV